MQRRARRFSAVSSSRHSIALTSIAACVAGLCAVPLSASAADIAPDTYGNGYQSSEQILITAGTVSNNSLSYQFNGNLVISADTYSETSGTAKDYSAGLVNAYGSASPELVLNFADNLTFSSVGYNTGIELEEGSKTVISGNGLNIVLAGHHAGVEYDTYSGSTTRTLYPTGLKVNGNATLSVDAGSVTIGSDTTTLEYGIATQKFVNVSIRTSGDFSIENVVNGIHINYGQDTSSGGPTVFNLSSENISVSATDEALSA